MVNKYILLGSSPSEAFLADLLKAYAGVISSKSGSDAFKYIRVHCRGSFNVKGTAFYQMML